MSRIPAGPGAERIADLFWAMTVLGTVVFLIFCGALAWALAHRREAPLRPTPEEDRRRTRMILLFGAALMLLMRFRPEGLVADRRKQLEFHDTGQLDVPDDKPLPDGATGVAKAGA